MLVLKVVPFIHQQVSKADLPLALPVKNNQPLATIAGGDLCDMALL